MAKKSGRVDEELTRITEAVLDRLGFELVDLETAGHRARPLLRLRIDQPDSEPGRGVTVDDCARVSREVEAALDAREDLLNSYILEVSSPGVERPLRKRRDFEHSIGRRIRVQGFEPLAQGARRIEAVLLGVEGSGSSERLRLQMADGTELEVPRSAVARANLVFDWNELGSGKSRERETKPLRK